MAHRHTWERSGGCKENPGCWDMGDGRMKFVSRCACGAEKTVITIYARGRSGYAGTLIKMADGRVVKDTIRWQ